MSEIFIKTWSCSCGYSQDFEPTRENQNVNFNRDEKFRLNDVSENECPSCALKGVRNSMMSRVTDDAKKARIRFFGSQQDIDDWKAEKMAKANNSWKESVKTKMKTEEGEEIEVEGRVKRTETDDDKRKRIDDEAAQFRILTGKEIADLKARHEG